MIRSLGLSALLLAVVASPATAAARADRSTLNLSYQAEAGYAAAVVLRCEPARGVHPRKGNACRALGKAHGDPARLPSGAGLCTMQYTPVSARVEGTWHGKRVAWAKTFGNACDMRRAMGDVMAF